MSTEENKPQPGHPADGDEQVTRLIHAVEGECHGLAITKDQAVAILSYVCPADAALQSPAPAPDADVRELSKWLNEEPNRPLDHAAQPQSLLRPATAAPLSDKKQAVDLSRLPSFHDDSNDHCVTAYKMAKALADHLAVAPVSDPPAPAEGAPKTTGRKCECTAYCGQYLMHGSCRAYPAPVVVTPAPAPVKGFSTPWGDADDSGDPQPKRTAASHKMAPLEPTPQMRKAAADAWLDCDSKLVLNKAAAALRAGIAAAPTEES